MNRIVVDWDGTLVEDDKWPEMGNWLPGARMALVELAEAFDQVVIFTCRTAPYERDEVTPRRNWDQIEAITGMLDEAGFSSYDNIKIWNKPWKPNAAYYIDNKGVRFQGDWGATLGEVLA